MAFTKTDPGITNTPTEAPATALPPVIIRGKRADPEEVEMRALMKEMLEQGPELVKNMPPQELEALRDLIHSTMIGGGSADTLVRMTELMHEGSKLLEKDPAILGNPEEDITEGVPIENGQVPAFSKLLNAMMCRVAGHQLDKETNADKNMVQAAGSPADQARAEKFVEDDKKLKQRLDAVCQP